MAPFRPFKSVIIEFPSEWNYEGMYKEPLKMVIYDFFSRLSQAGGKSVTSLTLVAKTG